MVYIVSFRFDLHIAAVFDSHIPCRFHAGMVCMNQTRPHCVNQMGMTQPKPLAERHGRGSSGERYGNGMVCVNPPSRTRQIRGRVTAWELYGMCELALTVTV
jgi:hypothetical protein